VRVCASCAFEWQVDGFVLLVSGISRTAASNRVSTIVKLNHDSGNNNFPRSL
jgi:hypothetical protein